MAAAVSDAVVLVFFPLVAREMVTIRSPRVVNEKKTIAALREASLFLDLSEGAGAHMVSNRGCRWYVIL